MNGADSDLTLTDREMSSVMQLVYRHSGITLHEGKRPLVLARLQKRLRVHGLTSFGAYLDHVERDQTGAELIALLDAIATNHTYFFREPQHFDLLRTRIAAAGAGSRRGPLRIWCAACSTGEEPYTIAMTLLDMPDAPDFTILASDLSTKALKAAASATYKMAAVQALPQELLRRHFERGMGAQEGLARVSREVTKRVSFKRLNLLETRDLGERFDVIFCRNVMIYFDKPAQQRAVSMLERHLRPGGHMFISHAESLNGITHAMRWVAPAVYREGGHV